MASADADHHHDADGDLDPDGRFSDFSAADIRRTTAVMLGLILLRAANLALQGRV